MTPRGGRSFQRRRAAPIFSGDRILIVCEDAKASPDYFRALLKNWRLQPAQVRVCGPECGSDPKQVVEYARSEKQKAKSEAKESGATPYDQVWCVVDTDHHGQNLQAARQAAQKHGIEIVVSNPCIEYWFLLHLEYTTTSFANCRAVERELRNRLGNYDKAVLPSDELLPGIDDAVTHSKSVRADHERTGASSPYTDVDLLIDALSKLRRP